MESTWKNDFWNLFFSKDINDLNKALILKQQNTPENLYRYRSISSHEALERVLDEIATGNIFLSNPKNFNDPFDSASVLSSLNLSNYLKKQSFMKSFSEFLTATEFDYIFSGDDWLDKIITRIAQRTSISNANGLKNIILSGYEDMNKIITEATREIIRIACFSSSNNNLPMWYHYTQDFTGICIEYNSTQIANKLLINKLFPVNYQNNIIDVMNSLNSDANSIRFEIHTRISSCKLKDWSYEKEWRLIMSDTDLGYEPNEPLKNETGELINFCKPTKVILGCKISHLAEKLIRNLCEENNIACVKSKITEFGLKID